MIWQPHRYHLVIVDGTPWTDADGNDRWPLSKAEDIEEHVRRQGYTDVEVTEA